MSEVIRRRRRSHQEKANNERWMISYADMLTLLLAFFIMMWAAASVNKSKLEQEAASILQAFEGRPPMMIQAPSTPRGIEHEAPDLVPKPLESVHAPAAPVKALKPMLPRGEQSRLAPMLEAMANLSRKLRQLLAAQIAQHQISLIERPLSLRIRLNAHILFPNGEASVTQKATKLLGSLGDILAKLPPGYLITVQGYTDNRPIHTWQFRSNWDLSAARAVSVVRLFRSHHVPGTALSAEGFSKYKPVATNSTKSGRADNRRVEILISVPKATTEKGSSPSRSQSAVHH